MNKLLPKTKLNPRGFTLVELLVVIVILAILGIVGITIFTGTQSKARDAKRKEDITAMGNAMEANYVAGVGYPAAVVGTWFADGVEPTNPAPPAGGVYTKTIPAGGASYTFCTPLENPTGNATSVTGPITGAGNTLFFCRKNSQ